MVFKTAYLLGFLSLVSSSLCATSPLEETYMEQRGEALSSTRVYKLPSADRLEACFQKRKLSSLMRDEDGLKTWAGKSFSDKMIWDFVEKMTRIAFDKSGAEENDKSKAALIAFSGNVISALVEEATVVRP